MIRPSRAAYRFNDSTRPIPTDIVHPADLDSGDLWAEMQIPVQGFFIHPLFNKFAEVPVSGFLDVPTDRVFDVSLVALFGDFDQ